MTESLTGTGPPCCILQVFQEKVTLIKEAPIPTTVLRIPSNLCYNKYFSLKVLGLSPHRFQQLGHLRERAVPRLLQLALLRDLPKALQVHGGTLHRPARPGVRSHEDLLHTQPKVGVYNRILYLFFWEMMGASLLLH